jgi:hypothetical protein
VTTVDNGFMAAADKVILNRLRTGFTQYINNTAQTNATVTPQNILFQSDQGSFTNGFFTKVNDSEVRADFTGRVEVTVEFHAHAANNDRRVEVGLYTNGTLVTGAVRRQVLRGDPAQGSTVTLSWIVQVNINDLMTAKFSSLDGSLITLPTGLASRRIRVYTLGLT